MVWSPQLHRVAREGGGVSYSLGHPLLDDFLEFCSGRARPNTLHAYAHDLKVFFTVVAKDPVEVAPADVMAFVAAQQQPRSGAENVVRFPDASSGLSPATVMRRLAAVSAFDGYLLAPPTPHRGQPGAERSSHQAHAARAPRSTARPWRPTAPEDPRSLGGGGTARGAAHGRDRAIVQAMLLGGLRRCEALGLRLEDVRLGECRVFIANGKGGHEHLVPLSPTFFRIAAAGSSASGRSTRRPTGSLWC